MVDFLGLVGFQADDLLSESKRIIVEDRLRQVGREAGRKLPLLKINLVQG
jgi:hypothetical protein